MRSDGDLHMTGSSHESDLCIITSVHKMGQSGFTGEKKNDQPSEEKNALF
jgi:hypothetical protein